MKALSYDESIRIPVSIAVETESEDDEPIVLFTQNVSAGGLYLESERLLTDAEVPVNDTISLFFQLPGTGSTPVVARGRIIRKEMIQTFAGDPCTGLAVEFVDMAKPDRARLKEFIVKYEMNVADEFLHADNEERAAFEITDAETALQSRTGVVLFEPLVVDDYQFLFEQTVEAKESNVSADELSPVQKIMRESLNEFSEEEIGQLKNLIKVKQCDLKQKIFLNLMLMRFKLFVECRLMALKTRERKIDLETLEFMKVYSASTLFELENSHEAAHLVGQRLVGNENWDEFRTLNHLRRLVNEAHEQLASWIVEFQQTHSGSQVQAGSNQERDDLEFFDLDRALVEVFETIPEEDEIPLSAGALDKDTEIFYVKDAWDVLVGLQPGKTREVIHKAFALRFKGIHDLHVLDDLAEEVVHYRNQVMAVFRDLAREIVRTTNDLIREGNDDPDLLQTTMFLVQELEKVTFDFGRVIRMIPNKFLSTGEIEAVRYRRATFRRKGRIDIQEIKAFSRRHAAPISFAITALFTLCFHFYFSYSSRPRKVPLAFSGDVPVSSALRQGDLITVEVARAAWKPVTPVQASQRIFSLETTTKREHAERYKLVDDRGALLGAKLTDKSGDSYHLIVFPFDRIEKKAEK